jgi:hypothetical protein
MPRISTSQWSFLWLICTMLYCQWHLNTSVLCLQTAPPYLKYQVSPRFSPYSMSFFIYRFQSFSLIVSGSLNLSWVTHAMKTNNILHDSSTSNIDSAPNIPSTLYTTPLKPLTDDEKTLLRQHLGCYKC